MKPEVSEVSQILPAHLAPFQVEQDYSAYTAIDQASWRFIMRVSEPFFKEHAHPMYVDGFKKAGISTESIPKISEMDDKLKQFGWRAVSITGYLPSEIFLEMLSLQILPIACDMRKLEHIEYTPAPDIVHEAAGHAPILADPSYSSFLKKFGEIARWVIFAKEDTDIYLATLELSEVKEDPLSTEDQVIKAQKRVDQAYAKVNYASEAQQVTRLGWWSTEYGLFKMGNRFLIYGAGLLSSAGESYACLSDDVKKTPLDIQCTEIGFDITRPQQQLFYTDDFKKIEATIDQLASTMAFKVGGTVGLERAKKAQTLTTSQTETGFQVSGVLEDFILSSNGQVCFLEFQGPCQIAHNFCQLNNHGPAHYKDSLHCVLGALEGSLKPKMVIGDTVSFNLDSGLEITGTIETLQQSGNKNPLLVLKSYHIKKHGEFFAMAHDCLLVIPFAKSIVSVFGGAADRTAYMLGTTPQFAKPRPPKVNVTVENRDLIPLYAEVRKIRESKIASEENFKALEQIISQLDKSYPEEWLVRLEILELLTKNDRKSSEAEALYKKLIELSQAGGAVKTLIARGLGLLKI